MSKLLGDSATNADKLAKALTKFDSGPLQKLNTEVRTLRDALNKAGVGRASTSSRSTPAGGGGGSYLPTGQHSTNGGHGTGQDGGSYLTGHWSTMLPVGPARAFGVAAVEAMSGAATLMRGHLQDAVGRSYLENRWQLYTGGPTSYGGQVGFGRRMAGMFGNNTLGYADTTQAASTLLATGAVSGGLGASRVSSSAFGAALNPTQGALGGAQMTSRVFTPQNYYRARLAGINQMAGGKQNLQSFMDQVIDRYESTVGRKLTQAEIQSGNQPGMPLFLTLQGLGFQDDGDRQNLLTYWSARNRTGKVGTAALSAAGANTGLFKQAQQTANARGQALSQADVGAQKGFIQGLRGKQYEYQVLGAMADDSPFGRVITDATGALSIFSSELKVVNKLMEAAIGGSILRRLLGGAGGGGGILGGAEAGGVFSRMAGRGGIVGAAGRFAPKLLRAGGIALGGQIASGIIDATGHHTTASIVGDAATGAAIGSFIGPEGTVVGAGLGAAWGGRHQIASGAKKAWHWAFGDSNRKTPPLSNSGSTWQQLEKIAQRGPQHVVTSTTSGGHAQNSYHYRGQAVDFAAPGGGSDTPGLLAINRFWASKYGKNLVELIYAGPGGICIKDGKVVNGNAFYGATTMAEHHNHVHVAATPASLGGAGGGVPLGASPANNAGTTGAGAAPASSSGGFAGMSPVSGSLIGSLFSSSSGGSLLAALGSIAGGAGGYATASPTGVGYASSGGGGGGGTASGNVPPAPQSVKGAVALGKRMAAARGWTGREWDALYRLWQNESGWNPGARNSSSGAAGIPQDITGNMHGGASGQITWGMNYIAHRYHDPVHALSFWNRTDPRPYPGHWYEGGKWELIRDEIAQLHKGEMVVPATTAERLRKAISAPETGARESASGGRRRTVPVQLIFMVQRGTEAEMRQAARQFAKYVEDDHDIELVASR